MATSLTDILASLQNGVTAINRVATALLAVFPHTTESSTGATAGAAALPAAPAGFLVVQTSSGYVCKVPYYNS